MPSDLDRKYDFVLDKVMGEGGPVTISADAHGRAIVANFPPTLPGLFKAFSAMYADREAIVSGDERISFPELDAFTDRLAGALVSGFSVRKGDRIAIAMRNAPGWIAAYMAVLKAGGVAVLINGWWEAGEMRHALELTSPKLVLADPERARRIAATDLALDMEILDIGRGLEEALAPIMARADDGTALPDIGPDDDATILFTSGSTGLSKGAVSTHRAVTTGVYAYAMGLMTLKGILESEGRPPANPRVLINVPLFHVTGEVPVMLNSFVVGRTMVLMPKWDAGEALRLIEKEGITYFVGVPTMSLELLSHPDRTSRNLSSLTDIAAGGAARPVAHVKRLREGFGEAQPALGYGLTETNAVGCGNFWSNYAAKPASTGRAQRPFVELAILGEDDAHLPAGESGEIAIRSAANISGYWNDPEATAAAFTADGYLKTGDVGYLDEDGYLFIVDRKKDIIIRGGENICCQEVEAALYGNADVQEAAVFGQSDDRLGEVPVAVVHGTASLSAAGLAAFLEGKLARFKHPDHIWISAEPLPKLGTGKIDKVALREAYARAANDGDA